MNKLSHEQVIEELNKLLGEDVSNSFEEQLQIAGDHGYPSFSVRNSKGTEIQVIVDWDKEADILSFSFYSDERM
jgi:hypothetical protein